VNEAHSRGLALAGTAALTALVGWPPTPAALIGALPLAAAFLAGLLRLTYWAIGTAIVMLPYFCYGVMLVLTDPAGRIAAAGFSALTIAVFLAALDTMRRR
jgi:uncharacterized membrane protein